MHYTPADQCWLCIKVAGWIPALAQAHAAIICVHGLWPRWWRRCRRYWIATRRIWLDGTIRLMNLFGSALMQRTNAATMSSWMHFWCGCPLHRPYHWFSQLPIICRRTIHSDGWIRMCWTLWRYWKKRNEMTSLREKRIRERERWKRVCYSHLLNTGAPFLEGVLGALRPPCMFNELFEMAPRSILPSIVFKRRNTSASVDRKQTISSCCVSTLRSKSWTRPNKLDFSDSNISSETKRTKTTWKCQNGIV